MSERRRLLSRPRTKVYDCNYNIGEGYYKSAVDELDRKYTGRSAAADAPAYGGRSLADRLSDDLRSSRLEETSPIREGRPKSNLLDEFDSLFENRRVRVDAGEEASVRRAVPRAYIVNDESNDFDDMLNRMRSTRAARNEAYEEALDSSVSTRRRPKLNIQSEIDNFFDESPSPRKSRLTGRSPANDLDEEPFMRRQLKTPDIDDMEPVRKLGALKSLEHDGESAAMSRARKSRARLAELEAEMDELSDRPPRGRRVMLADDNYSTAATAGSAESVASVRVRKTVQTEKKTVTVRRYFGHSR